MNASIETKGPSNFQPLRKRKKTQFALSFKLKTPRYLLFLVHDTLEILKVYC